MLWLFAADPIPWRSISADVPTEKADPSDSKCANNNGFKGCLGYPNSQKHTHIVYVYTYDICIYIHIYIHTHVYLYIYIHVYVCIYIHMYI